MSLDNIEETLSHRFRLATSPSIAVAMPHDPIVFSHLRSDEKLTGRSIEMPGEDAFAYQVPLTGRFFGDLWNGARHTKLPPAQPAAVYLFDFNDQPVVALDRPFDTMRMYISQRTLDALADENEMSRTNGLHAERYGTPDSVLYGLAQTLKASLAIGTASTLFFEHMAYAFHEHVRTMYADKGKAKTPPRGGLAPWQLNRAHEYIDAFFAQDFSIVDLARTTGLSASHFAKAFKQSTGVTPHQWLIGRRMQRVRELLLQGEISLAQIAILCGFVDQSHLTRTFIRAEKSTPGAWRRLHKR
jgi:AraC-like DNA-binding protein